MSNADDLKKIEQAEKELKQLEAQYIKIVSEASLAGASMLPPPVGTAADIASLTMSLSKGNWGDALIDIVGIIPLGGDAVKAVIKGPKIVAQKKKVLAAIDAARVKLAQEKLALKTNPKELQKKTGEACKKGGTEPCPNMGGEGKDTGADIPVTTRDTAGVLRSSDGRYATDNTTIRPHLNRPSLRTETKRSIEAKAPKNSKGQFIDEEGKVISKPHYGHISGHENRRILVAADELELTQSQLNDYVNARPESFKIEEAQRNLSHVDEVPGVDNIDHIVIDMENFFDL